MVKKKVIPTLFALDKKEFDDKLSKLKDIGEIHIDFMDGEFTEKRSVGFDVISVIKDYKDVDFGIHLMAYEPEEYASRIKKFGIKRAYIHFEAFETDTDLQYSIEEFRSRDIEVGLVLNPGTDVEEAFSYVGEVDSILLMSVWPGQEGQKFISNTYSRLKELRREYSDVEICVDGGINAENIREISTNGADVFFVGSYISGDKSSKQKYDELLDKL